ncbi:cupredoxin domain-containing protein [Candidatus Woesearchaeota archaeon]|nr:cupredoxin domain-containing protein [Candidatus Woesearchaeota archaeon]
MNKFVLLSVLLAILPVVAAASEKVDILDFDYSKPEITVNVGDTIEWTNTGTAPHTVTTVDKAMDSGRLGTGQAFSKTFDKPGTHEYFCEFHPRMKAKVIVTGGAPTVAQRNPELTVQDQSLVNNEVVIENAFLDKPGFVVIHQDKDGSFGPFLAKSELFSGQRTNLRIEVDSAGAGSRVHPMLHYDVNNNGVYEFPGPDVPVTVNNEVVVRAINLQQALPASTPLPPRLAPAISAVLPQDVEEVKRDVSALEASFQEKLAQLQTQLNAQKEEQKSVAGDVVKVRSSVASLTTQVEQAGQQAEKAAKSPATIASLVLNILNLALIVTIFVLVLRKKPVSSQTTQAKPAADAQLKEYVKRALEAGKGKEALRSDLVASGWKPEDVDAALAVA